MINPYLPETEFIPDGELHRFGDRIYLYGSHDLTENKALCAGDYVCWSADPDNLQNWRYEGVIYKRTQDPYIAYVISKNKVSMFNGYLYAPDVVQVKDMFYLYYGVAMSGAGIAVAKSNSPTGPFTYIGRVRYPQSAMPTGWKDPFNGLFEGDYILGEGMPMIQLNPFRKYFGINMKNYVYDPALLLDGDHLYLYYGCGYCYVVEISLKDMRTLIPVDDKGNYITGPLLPSSGEKKDKEKIRKQDGWHMGNGASIRKIDGRYYLSYYAVKKHHGNALCYSVGNSPRGPFTYGGILVSLGNAGINGQKEPDAPTGNIHGGMVYIGGKWYQNFHRHTGGPSVARQGWMTELIMDADGNFFPSEYKSQIQAEGGLNWNDKIRSSAVCVMTNVRGISKKGRAPYLICQEGRQVLKGLSEGSVSGFKYLEFPEDEIDMCCNIEMSNSRKGKVYVYLDSVTKENIIAVIELRECKNSSMKFTAKVTGKCTGIHGVFFQFWGQSKRETKFLEFQFLKC